MAILSRPMLTVEGAFSTLEDGTLIWNDITDYVDLDMQAIDIQQRRSSLFDERSPGTLAFLVDNSDSRFTKENVSSPYYPGVSQNTPLRVRIQSPSAANLLSGAQSRTEDENAWTAAQGSLTTWAPSNSWDFEDGTVQGWGSYQTGGAITTGVSTAWANSGSLSFLGTVSTKPTGGNWELTVTTAVGSCMPGDVVTAQAVVHAPQALTHVVLGIDWKTSAGTYISSSSNTYTAFNSNDTKTLTLSNALAPATASQFTLWVQEGANSNVGTGMYVDDISYWTAPFLQWATGVLEQTGIHVTAGDNPWGEPAEKPIYCKPGEKVSASVALRADATISASVRLGWFDIAGQLLSEVASGTTSLTTSFQTLSITNQTAPANTCSVRFAIANETAVAPAARAISYSGGDDDNVRYNKRCAVQIPSSANVGDLALLWTRISDTTHTFTGITGWTNVNTWTDSRGKTRLDRKILTEADIGKTIKSWWNGLARGYCGLAIYSGVNQATPLHQNAEAAESTFQTTHVTPNVTTTIAGCWIHSAVFDTSTTTTVWSPPGGEVVRQYSYGYKGNAVGGIITDDATAHATGTYGTKTFTSNVKSKFATMHTIALGPASGTGPGNINIYAKTPMLVKATSLPGYVDGGDITSLITAYADSWTQEWDVDRPRVVVTATDRTKLLQAVTVGSAIQETIMKTDPSCYYMLNESSSTDSVVLASDSSGNSQHSFSSYQQGTGGELQWATGTGPGVDGMAALTMAPVNTTNGIFLTTELNSQVGGSNGLSAGFFLASSQAAATEVTPAKVTCTSAANRFWLEFFGKAGGSPYAGVKFLDNTDSTNTYLTCQAATNYFDGATHRWDGTVSIEGGNIVLTLYIDGAQVAQTSQATNRTYVPLMNNLSIGNAWGSNQRLCAGTYSHFTVHSEELVPDDIANIYTAGITAFAGDSVSSRFQRILDWKGLSGTNFEQSDVLVDRHMPDTTSLLAALQLVAATDGGTLWIDGNDDIAFRASRTKEIVCDPSMTMDGVDLGASPSSVLNDDILINDVTINRLGAGTSQHLSNDTSILKNMIHNKTIDTLLTTDAEAREMCGYYLAFYAQPYTRFDQISVQALLEADWSGILACDMWQIIRLTGLPASAPASTLDMHVEGHEWNIDSASWMVNFDVSFAVPFAVVGDPVRGMMGQVVVAR
jgi:hypothetical protein